MAATINTSGCEQPPLQGVVQQLPVPETWAGHICFDIVDALLGRVDVGECTKLIRRWIICASRCCCLYFHDLPQHIHSTAVVQQLLVPIG